MKITFITTQTSEGSTVVGRVFPLAEALAKNRTVSVILHKGGKKVKKGEITVRTAGKDPFTLTPQGKKRLRGLRLIARMAGNAMSSAFALWRLNPDVAVIVKPLPENVLAVYMWRAMRRNKRVILDSDDFELMANKLSSGIQRAAIHWAERTAAHMASSITAASPFLFDHFRQLSDTNTSVHIIPTGLSLPKTALSSPSKTPRLLYIGSISVSSGHRVDMLARIAAEVKKEYPGVMLTIAGSGDDMEKLQKEVKELGLQKNVSFTGRFSMKDIPSLTQHSPIIIDPIDASFANRAKSSFRTNLAAALGLPLVSSNIGIRPQMVPDSLHQRFFAKPENIEDYSRHVLSLIRKPLSLEDKKLLQAHAKKNTWERIGSSFNDIIAA